MHLTEEKLGTILENIFNKKFHHDKKVPDSGILNRPDYRNDELMLIVEFDGYLHFSSAKTIISDEIKDKRYSEMGYKIIRIPYFIQIDTETVKYFFWIDLKVDSEYPHGFISDKAMLPCDFNAMGVKRYLEIINNIPSSVALDIEESLKNKASAIDDRLVYF